MEPRDLLKRLESLQISARHAITYVIVIEGRDDDDWTISCALLEAANDRLHELPFPGRRIAKFRKWLPGHEKVPDLFKKPHTGHGTESGLPPRNKRVRGVGGISRTHARKILLRHWNIPQFYPSA